MLKYFSHLGRKGKTGLKLQPTNYPFRHEKIIWTKPPWFCSIFRACKTACFSWGFHCCFPNQKNVPNRKISVGRSFCTSLKRRRALFTLAWKHRHTTIRSPGSPTPRWNWHFRTWKWMVGIPSRELTYPTLGKGKSSSKCHFWGIC